MLFSCHEGWAGWGGQHGWHKGRGRLWRCWNWEEDVHMPVVLGPEALQCATVGVAHVWQHCHMTTCAKPVPTWPCARTCLHPSYKLSSKRNLPPIANTQPTHPMICHNPHPKPPSMCSDALLTVWCAMALNHTCVMITIDFGTHLVAIRWRSKGTQLFRQQCCRVIYTSKGPCR